MPDIRRPLRRKRRRWWDIQCGGTSWAPGRGRGSRSHHVDRACRWRCIEHHRGEPAGRAGREAWIRTAQLTVRPEPPAKSSSVRSTRVRRATITGERGTESWPSADSPSRHSSGVRRQIAAGGVLRTAYGAGLLVTTEDGIPAGGPGKIQGLPRHRGGADRLRLRRGAGRGPRLVRRRQRAALALHRAVGDRLTCRRRCAAVRRGLSPTSMAPMRAVIIAQTEFSIDLSSATTYAAISHGDRGGVQRRIGSGRPRLERVGRATRQSPPTATFSGGGGTRQATGTVVVESGVVYRDHHHGRRRGLYQRARTIAIADSTAPAPVATATAVLCRGQRCSRRRDLHVRHRWRVLLTLAGADDIASDVRRADLRRRMSPTLLGFGATSGTTLPPGARYVETLSEALAEMVPQASSGPPTLPMVDGSCPNEVSGCRHPRIARDVRAGRRLFRVHPRQRADALAAAGTFRHYVFAQQLSQGRGGRRGRRELRHRHELHRRRRQRLPVERSGSTCPPASRTRTSSR